MTFAESLAEFSAAEIVAALGCPRQTAYAWLDGSRKPPVWQQELFLAVIAKESKMHNKASLATDTSREAGSRKWKS
jgi:tRNA U34 5-methylaminomethyl-2-thiouridine-forming methyltransferase MnmC